MKIVVFILSSFIYSLAFGQLDSLIEFRFYIDSINGIEQRDSIDKKEGYPRGGGSGKDALTYAGLQLNSNQLNKHVIIIDKVTEKYLKKYILDTLQLPVIKIPLDSINANQAVKNKIQYEIVNNNWWCYLKNDNVWILNIDSTKSEVFTVNNILRADSIGAKIFNFCLFASIAYSKMDDEIEGYTVRQICNSMGQIIKRKDTGRIMIRLYRQGAYLDFEDIMLLINNGFLLHTLNDVKDACGIYQLCEVDNVDQDISECTDYLTTEDF
jgi:hypothetical protein